MQSWESPCELLVEKCASPAESAAVLARRPTSLQSRKDNFEKWLRKGIMAETGFRLLAYHFEQGALALIQHSAVENDHQFCVALKGCRFKQLQYSVRSTHSNVYSLVL